MRTNVKWWAAAIAVALSMSLPTAAAAAPIDTTSDHVALGAYGRYLRGVMSRLPAARGAEDAYIASIATACPNVLAAINGLPAQGFNRAAAIAFGEELAGDILVTAYHADRAPFAKLAGTLTRLPWSSPQTIRTINLLIASQSKLFRLGPSDLCTDAQALMASNVGRTPTGTTAWLARFGRLASVQARHQRAFLSVLQQFDAPDDAGQLAANNRLARRFMTAFSALTQSEATRLARALGLSL
jgi:hypothetical protein